MKNKINVTKKLLAAGLVLGLAVNLTGCAKKEAFEAQEADSATVEADAADHNCGEAKCGEAKSTEEAATTEEAAAPAEEKAAH